MPKINKSKDDIETTVVKKDGGFIILYGKPYEVNQNAPSIELITKCSLIKEPMKHIEKESERYTKMINILREEEDNILMKTSFSLLDIEKIDDLEKRIDDYKRKSVSPITELSDAIYDMINWLLGSSALKVIKEKNISYTDLTDILQMSSEENPFLRDYANR